MGKNSDKVFIDEFHYAGLPWAEHGAVIQHTPTDHETKLREANYQRAKKCVEACFGIEKPDVIVVELLDFVKQVYMDNDKSEINLNIVYDMIFDIGRRIS